MDQLAAVNLLRGLEPAERERLAKRCVWRSYRKDQTVVENASDDRDVYFVISGSVRIVNFALSGKPVAYASLGAGEFFGELAAIDGQPRSATVVANEASQLASLSPHAFIELMQGHPDLSLAVMRRLAGIVRSCDERIMDLATLGAMQRVIMELCRLSKPDPITAGSWMIYPCPAQREIAARASTTRETVARVFTQLLDSNQIRRKGRSLYLQDRKALEALAYRLAPGANS
ncbi:MAG: Crp/Fnr family transcriptional regulator [Alphaproteobacteria bacterium]|nr:Crp/Fnr family transcriptional regulator [Alphaproteobacteria bacterium]MCB9929021.1 Crp/Fnr family transcriptional regulator [Alphaproteobacteria bacterium]